MPPVTTQQIEAIECEIGNINIEHTDPVYINTKIELLMKDKKLIKLQECNPQIKCLRKQYTEMKTSTPWKTTY